MVIAPPVTAKVKPVPQLKTPQQDQTKWLWSWPALEKANFSISRVVRVFTILKTSSFTLVLFSPIKDSLLEVFILFNSPVSGSKVSGVSLILSPVSGSKVLKSSPRILFWSCDL